MPQSPKTTKKKSSSVKVKAKVNTKTSRSRSRKSSSTKHTTATNWPIRNQARLGAQYVISYE
jgi:hypothetical protein